MHTYCLLPLILCLFKPIPHVYTPKMAEHGLVLTLPLFTLCPGLCNKSFSTFTMPLYWVYGASRTDLTCGIPGVWALGPKLQFHNYSRPNSNFQKTKLPSPQSYKFVLVCPVRGTARGAFAL
jgi:hypothetical protein